jgi:hypothetical protein
MGETPPKFLDLSCEDCGTRFRIRPTKGRLPKGPVECPSCGKHVFIEQAPLGVPATAVFRSHKGSKSEEARLEEVLASLPKSAAANGTLLGMAVPISLQPEPRPSLNERTAVATGELFPDSSDFDYGERVVSHTPTQKMLGLDEHSESAYNNRTKAPWESESLKKAARQANIVEKINPRKTQPNLETAIQATNIELSSKSDVFADEPSDPAKSEAFAREITKSSTSGERPKLADLLKQVREKRGPFVTPLPAFPGPKAQATPSAADDDFLPDAEELAADLGLSMPSGVLSPNNAKDNRMTPFGKARAETVVRALESHGMAAEKTGSGFIRIPTAEILDLIGTGTYRLQVENVVYEPIDEVGIRRLVRTEFLTGDELVAERGGDWTPMRVHAFFSKSTAPIAPTAPIEQLTTELEISDAEAVEDLFEPPAVLGDSDSSGELFPTIGHLSPDQSAEIELSYAESSSSEISVDDDVPESVDAPMTAELDLDDLDVLEVVQGSSPPEPPAVLDTALAKPSSFRPVWLVVGLVALAGVLVGSVFRSQIFGSNDASIDLPIAETTPELVPPLVAPTTAAQIAGATATAAQVVEVTEEVPEVVEQVVEVAMDGVRRLSAAEFTEPTLGKEGKTPIIKFSLNGLPMTFIADTGESQRSFRSNLAVAALCRAAACGIDFAKTQEAFLASDELKTLGFELNGAVTKVKDIDGIKGVLRWDVQGAAQLPLAELTSVWRKWMGLNDQDLDKAVFESESDLVKAIGQERTTALLAQAGQLRVRDLVKQISNVLVLDYLTNNFERFESGQGPTTWNLAVKNGKVVSLDDGGAFQSRASTRIKGRFSWVEKFDKTMFDSLAQLNREAIEPTLIPEATAAERVALRVFWKQQQAYVDHVKKETLRRPDALFF